MPFVRGFLRIVSGGAPDQGLPPGEVDPGWGVEPPVDPGFGRPGPPIDPGFGFPLPPVDPGFGRPGPGYPSGQPVPPTYPVDPGYDLPTRPGVWPQPPIPPHPGQNPPLGPPLLPSHPIYRPDKPSPQPPAGTPTQPIYQPGHVWPPLPPSVTGTLVCFTWIVGVGYRWVVIDADASAEHPIVEPKPPKPEDKPPTAQPKR